MASGFKENIPLKIIVSKGDNVRPKEAKQASNSISTDLLIPMAVVVAADTATLQVATFPLVCLISTSPPPNKNISSVLLINSGLS